MAARSSARAWWLRGTALAGALALSVGFGELALRLAGVSYPVLVEPDPVAGGRLRPFVAGWFEQEGRAWIEANDIGYRDRVHARQKPANALRVAFLGDSYTEAMQVPLEQAYWRLVESRLTGCAAAGGRVPEAMSFGLSGIGTAQQLEIYRKVAAGYDPDVVVLAFVPNDIENNHPAFGGAGTKPFYALDARGALVLDDSFVRSPEYARRNGLVARGLRRLSDASRIVQLLLEARRVLARRELAAGEAGARHGFTAAPAEPERIEAWQWTEALLVELARRVELDGARFLLVAVSGPHQVHPSLEHRQRWLAEVGGGDLLYWNRRLAALAGAHGIAFLSLSEPFQEYALERGTCLHGFENMLPCDGHWNAAGHALAAELVSAAICAELSHGSAEDAS